MKISDLPKGLKELAELRRKEFCDRVGNYQIPENLDELSSAFHWDVTIEGLDFWNKVNDGKLDAYYSGIIKLEDIPINYEVVKPIPSQLDRIEKELLEIKEQIRRLWSQ